jgi:hypothetical protein
VAAEPAVATGELRRLAAEPLGQFVRGLVVKICNAANVPSLR